MASAPINMPTCGVGPRGCPPFKARPIQQHLTPQTKNGARSQDLSPSSSAVQFKSHRRVTLPHKKCAVPSPKQGLTSVFGMGTGVAPALWTVGKPSAARGHAFTQLIAQEIRRIFATEYLSRLERLVYIVCSCVSRHMSDQPIQLVKPHERLVLVSSTHYCASTSNLSNSSSWSALQGTEVPGRSRLEAGFPLRCFQRLSNPNVATRLCHWRDNRSTIGSSIPVLSY